jgi:Predicted transcriptional regulators
MRLNIEAERSRLQMTKESLSQELGITSKTYLSYIREDSPIPSDVLLSMAKLFGCSTDYLLISSECRN